MTSTLRASGSGGHTATQRLYHSGGAAPRTPPVVPLLDLTSVHVPSTPMPYGAPITSYDDPRLFGTPLCKALSQSIKEITHFFNPYIWDFSIIKELAYRTFILAKGLFSLILTLPLGLIGKVCQMTHYHFFISSKTKEKTPLWVPEGFAPDDFPEFTRTRVRGIKTPGIIKYVVDHEAARALLADGFHSLEESPEVFEICHSSHEQDSEGFKQLAKSRFQFTYTLSISPHRVLDLTRSKRFIEDLPTQIITHLQECLDTKDRQKAEQLFTELVLKNGYQAVRSTSHDGPFSTEEITIYDPDVLTLHNFRALMR